MYTFHRIALQACPLYIAEIAPKEIRGIMVSILNGTGGGGLVVRHSISCPSLVLQTNVHTINIFLQAGIVVNAITEKYTFGWRLSLSIPVLVGLVLAVGALFIPETPR